MFTQQFNRFIVRLAKLFQPLFDDGKRRINISITLCNVVKDIVWELIESIPRASVD